MNIFNYEINYPLLANEYLGNTVSSYIESFILLVAFLIIFQLIQALILNRLNDFSKKTKTDIDDTLIKIIKQIQPSFYVFLAFYLAIKNIEIGEIVQTTINWVLIVWTAYLAIRALQILIDYIFNLKIKKESGNTEQALQTLKLITKITLWILGSLFILSNIGVDVSSALAGLGIGGIAIALAAQNILGDLFSSFAIYFDKPFETGDFIIVDNKMGTVEKIGIKTTRIRALQGEEIVISNKELTSANIQNFKKMEERRIVFSFGVTYSTPTEKLKIIPEMIEKIIKEQSLTKFDRVHFQNFGDSALNYEAVYYISSSDYNIYMDTQQNINLAIKDLFEQEKIDMAFPTQTVHLVKS